MSSSSGSFTHVNDSFNSFQRFHNTGKGTIELDAIKTTDLRHKAEWQYTGNRDAFYSSSASIITQDQGYSIEEKALVRKIDWLVMPIICTLQFLQFLDKSMVGYAGLLSVKSDIKFEGSQFSLIGSVFYIGFLLSQIPNNYMLQNVPVGKYIGVIVIIWGAILVSTAFSKSFVQMAVLRCLMGFFEAGVYPSLTLLVSTLYRRSEQIVRLGAFWICDGTALFAGGLVSYGISHMENVDGLRSWQWSMIIIGTITIAMGAITLLFLIDSPKSTALKLNAEEEILVEERARDNETVRTTEVKTEQIWEAVKEIRFWCFILVCFLINLQNGAMSIYNGQITSGFGFDIKQSMLLSAGSGGATIVFIALAVIGVKKTGQTIYTACALLTINVIGLLLLLVIPLVRLKLIGYYMSWTYCSVYVLMTTSISNNVTGYTKKIFYNGAVVFFYALGNIIGPLMMVTPPYVQGMVAYFFANILAIVLLLVARSRMALVNKRRLLFLSKTTTSSAIQAYCQNDISDEQDQTFIYLL